MSRKEVKRILLSFGYTVEKVRHFVLEMGHPLLPFLADHFDGPGRINLVAVAMQLWADSSSCSWSTAACLCLFSYLLMSICSFGDLPLGDVGGKEPSLLHVVEDVLVLMLPTERTCACMCSCKLTSLVLETLHYSCVAVSARKKDQPPLCQGEESSA